MWNRFPFFWRTRPGRLAEVTRILAEAGINIRALSLADTSDFGILRLIVNDNSKAKEELKKAGFTVGKTDVVAVEVQDRRVDSHLSFAFCTRPTSMWNTCTPLSSKAAPTQCSFSASTTSKRP